jgi:hypothetical protein
MSRRRRRNEEDVVRLVVGLAFLVAFGMATSRSFRAFVFSVAVFVLFAVVLGVGFLVFRVVRDHRRSGGQAQQSWAGRSITLDEDGIKQALEAPSAPPPLPPPELERPRAPSRDELIARLRSLDWFQFEKIVGVVYRKLGYVVTRRGGAKPDGGIDLVIEKDGVMTGVQCKQWKTWNVGVKPVREMLGALTDADLKKGVFVTLRGYTGEARELADRHGIQILNETTLADMLETADARFDPEIIAALNDARKYSDPA